MPASQPGEIMMDGTLDFSGGVDSIKVTTVQSQLNPGGISRNELTWLDNATVRDGGITQRTGWALNQKVNNGSVLYQGGFLYSPLNALPYFIFGFSGHIWKVDPNNPSQMVDLSVQFGVYHPANQPKFYFCQGEEFLVIQAGDGVTLPLFWDGATLRRSRGLLGVGIPSTTGFSVTLTNINAPTATKFPAQTGTDNPLGVPYNSFIAPDHTLAAPANQVTVSLTAATSVKVGDTVLMPYSTTGQMQLISAVASGGGWDYTYHNLGIPNGTAVPAQYAPSTTSGDGATFPAFTATTPNVVFHFAFPLHNPGLVNVWSFTALYTFTVAAVANGEADTQQMVNELPSATAMTYYQGRIWYAQGQVYAAGDAVYGQFGTTFYNFRDSILKVTENPLVFGGDGFHLPANAGDITALFYNANLNAPLGQAQLLIATAKMIFALQVPATRSDWIGLTGQNLPVQSVVQINNGVAGDRSVVLVNGDVFYQSLEPGIRSLFASVRYFQQWGNIEISSNEQRILNFVDRSLLPFSTGITFDNRLLESSLPVQKTQGVVHQALIPMDFIPLSQFGANLNPTWEGMYEGLDFFQLFVGNFGGLERGFGLALSRTDSSIQLWELTNYQRFDYNVNGETRVQWIIEFPAFTWGREFALKKLVGCELWVDKVYGTVEFKMEFRPDGEPCWKFWHQWKVCTAKNSAEDVINPIGYPLTNYREAYRQTMNLPQPPDTCETVSGRPAADGYQFQARLTITGWCRVRGFMLKALPLERKTYSDITC